MTGQSGRGADDPFAHIPEGRFLAGDRFTWPDPRRDAAVLGKRVRVIERTATASVVLLGAAALAGVWVALRFATRGADDVKVAPSGRIFGEPAQYPGNTYWSADFLIWTLAPLGVAILLCAVPFLWWHIKVDRTARETGKELATEAWQVQYGWFVPLANLILPFRSIRGLTRASDAGTATRLCGFWWALWVTTYVLQSIVANTAPYDDLDVDRNSVDRLENVEKIATVAGLTYSCAAVLAILMVRNLTAAVRYQLESTAGES